MWDAHTVRTAKSVLQVLQAHLCQHCQVVLQVAVGVGVAVCEVHDVAIMRELHREAEREVTAALAAPDAVGAVRHVATGAHPADALAQR